MSVIGVATFHPANGSKIKGYITFKELENGYIRIRANLEGLPTNHSKLAWHIHESGDLRGQGCKAACSHFNPYGVTHGGPTSFVKHIGDLGNLNVTSKGTSKTVRDYDFIDLRGPNSIIGRSLVIHEKPDDMGLGGDSESLKTGNAGSRIGCAVIGYAKKSQLYF